MQVNASLYFVSGGGGGSGGGGTGGGRSLSVTQAGLRLQQLPFPNFLKC